MNNDHGLKLIVPICCSGCFTVSHESFSASNRLEDQDYALPPERLGLDWSHGVTNDRQCFFTHPQKATNQGTVTPKKTSCFSHIFQVCWHNFLFRSKK